MKRSKKQKHHLICLLTVLAVLLSMTVSSFGAESQAGQAQTAIQDENAGQSDPTGQADSPGQAEPAGQEGDKDQEAEKNGDIMILYTSDIHCGVTKGFGLAGLSQIRDSLEAQGYTTILVDDGDAIQGETLGVISKGKMMTELMNAMHYDVAIPGNHEFDYGLDRFLELTDKAEVPYISCNFNKEGKLVFEPYRIVEAAGKKIAFVGITTPQSLSSANPVYFQNGQGEYIYGFMQDESGEALYKAVQDAVDDAREEGADYVYVMGHLGLEEECRPWTYADVISNTTGIDVVLDGHSHDTEQVVMKNREGEEVVRSACGTKLTAIGYSHISAEDGIVDTNIWTWNNQIPAPELLDIRNDMRGIVDAKLAAISESMKEVVGRTEVDLKIYDPVAKYDSGSPVRMIRITETNLGDLVADAYRTRMGAQIGFAGGGALRAEVLRGDITYGNLLNVIPYGNEICVIELTGQQILDALEWSARTLPGESGGFQQVSGISFEIDLSVESGCKADEKGMYKGIEGSRRVKNVKVGDRPIDPAEKYSVAGIDFLLLNKGDGYSMFDGARVLTSGGITDVQVLIEYITEDLNGTVGKDYEDPFGQGRITILDDPSEKH